jgi:hypothetical protein
LFLVTEPHADHQSHGSRQEIRPHSQSFTAWLKLCPDSTTEFFRSLPIFFFFGGELSAPYTDLMEMLTQMHEIVRD